jgi:demethylmenaquinone methyltransferase/2-methoxy-6-polyprenyl-1,4-benzoquinol methylase
MTVDKSEQRIRSMFGEISSRYDFLNHFLSGGVDYYWRWRTVREAPPRGSDPILDVCTGTGDLALAYWKRSDGQVQVIGTDFTHEMLRLARQKAAQFGPARLRTEGRPVQFFEADTQQLPFPDDQFQLVTVAFGLRNVTDTRRGLREMARVCRPGGRVAVLEFSLPGNRCLRSLYQWYFRNVLPHLGQLLSRNRHMAYNYLPQSVAEFPQDEQLASMFREAGLTDVVWKPLTFGVATLYVGVKPEGALSGLQSPAKAD